MKQKTVTKTEKNVIHAQPWSFRQTEEKSANIWEKGIDGKSIFKKSIPPKKIIKNDAVSADVRALSKTQKHHLKSTMGLSARDEGGSWKVAPLEKDMRPDEDKPRDNRHVLGAYADVEAAQNLKIRVGPELILKDESKGDEQARMDQPDSAFGVGMKFQYGF